MAPTEEATPPPEQPRHHATVVTSAGSVEANVVDGHLEIEVVSTVGWESSVDRGDDHARVAWTSADRTVEVRIGSSATGISQEVLTTG